MSILFTNFFEKINQISPLEADFTEVLSSIALTPKILYFRGKMPENMVKTAKSSTTKPAKSQHKTATKSSIETRTSRPKTVAIVGSRHNTKYGEEVAYKLAYELGKKGVIVVSGLAYGIDSIAHRGCLDAGGITVAVLGTRIDDIYPKEHLSLARKIIEQNGAIVSEYAPIPAKDAPLALAEAGWDGSKWISYATENSDNPPAHQPFIKRKIDPKTSFLYRNRLVSGLADIVVVVEAAERSGSLSTATHALEQGKDVFAVPGNITSPYSQGCNKLIRQGAFPYTEPSDVLRELFPEDYVKQYKKHAQLHLFGDTDVETKILQAIYNGARTGEEIMQATHLPPEVFNEAVTLLEIKSRLRSLGMNSWGLI